jgi:hypothetical protein
VKPSAASKSSSPNSSAGGSLAGKAGASNTGASKATGAAVRAGVAARDGAWAGMKAAGWLKTSSGTASPPNEKRSPSSNGDGAGRAGGAAAACSARRRWASPRVVSIFSRASSSRRAVRSSLWRMRSTSSCEVRSWRWFRRSVTRVTWSPTSSMARALRRSALLMRSASFSVIRAISAPSFSRAWAWTLSARFSFWSMLAATCSMAAVLRASEVWTRRFRASAMPTTSRPMRSMA